MRIVEAYQSADGALFLDEADALGHDANMLGEELDGLLRHVFAVEGVGMIEYQRAAFRAMNRRAELRAACAKILQVLDHGGDE